MSTWNTIVSLRANTTNRFLDVQLGSLVVEREKVTMGYGYILGFAAVVLMGLVDAFTHTQTLIAQIVVVSALTVGVFARNAHQLRLQRAEKHYIRTQGTADEHQTFFALHRQITHVYSAKLVIIAVMGLLWVGAYTLAWMNAGFSIAGFCLMGVSGFAFLLATVLHINHKVMAQDRALIVNEIARRHGETVSKHKM